MKKIIFLLIVSASLAISSHAQRASLFPLVAGDTISTSASLDTVSKIVSVTAGYAALGIQVNFTKVSGTITNKAYLYSSIDGVGYQLTDSATAFANSAGLQSVWFTKVTAPYVYYKVMVRNIGASTSTESGIVRVYYVLRKHD
jgi:hypothetical protein